MSMPDFLLDGYNLSLSELVSISRNGRKISLSESSLAEMERSYSWVARAANGEFLNAQGEPRAVYGVNTGFGSLARVRIPQEKIEALSRNLIRSHAAGVGEPAPHDVARAMALLRANALAKGSSGCRPLLVERLVELINAGVAPVVPSQGSCGSSGDLAPLAHLGLLLSFGVDDPDDETGEAYFDGERITGRDLSKRLGIEPVVLGPKEGLALTNGAQLSTAYAAIACFDASWILKCAEIAAAISIEALLGVTRAFHPMVHALRPYDGSRATAANLLVMLEGSELVNTVSGKIQDAYSLRCTPQVFGSARDALAHVEHQLVIELNAVTDNPVFCLDADSEDKAFSAGLFHGEHVGMVADYMKIAVSEIASLSERRLYRLVTTKLSADLPSSLAISGRSGLGLFGLQTTAAALVSENKSLGWPSSMDSIPTCEDQEDHVAMSTTAARRAADVVENTRKVIAIELVAGLRALQFRQDQHPQVKFGAGTSVAFDYLVANTSKDLVPSEAVEEMLGLMEGLIERVESVVGPLLSVGEVPS
jgi:histidine ammonia-lyase